MEEIRKLLKVRVWNNREKKMIYPEDRGIDIFIHLNGRIMCSSEDYGCMIFDEEGIYTPMACNFEKDLNGKEIYEGDIVKWKEVNVEGESLIGVVAWSGCSFYVNQVNSVVWSRCPMGESLAKFYSVYDFVEQNFRWKDLEIVGNVYENESLMEEYLKMKV